MNYTKYGKILNHKANKKRLTTMPIPHCLLDFPFGKSSGTTDVLYFFTNFVSNQRNEAIAQPLVAIRTE